MRRSACAMTWRFSDHPAPIRLFLHFRHRPNQAVARHRLHDTGKGRTPFRDGIGFDRRDLRDRTARASNWTTFRVAGPRVISGVSSQFRTPTKRADPADPKARGTHNTYKSPSLLRRFAQGRNRPSGRQIHIHARACGAHTPRVSKPFTLRGTNLRSRIDISFRWRIRRVRKV